MKATDLYRKALYKILSDKQKTQAYIADQIGVQSQTINDFIRGRRNFSETKKEEIARVLGTTYIDMLNLGRKLSENGVSEKEKQANIVPIPHKDLIDQFIDQETGRRLNEMLIAIEHNDPKKYEAVKAYIMAKFEDLEIKKISSDE